MTVAEGAAVVEQVRQQIARCPLTVAGRPVRLSFSAGVAGAEGRPSLDELFAKADSGLYRAKEQGRDQVVAA
jgi:diguanylate cyclase (GGDEF)-like protein